MGAMRINVNVLRSLIAEALDNAYDVLGVQPGADEKEVKRAWRNLIMQYRAEDASGDGFAHVKINHANKALAHLLGAGKTSGDPMYTGYEGPSVELPRDPDAPKKKAVRPNRTADSYKVYPWKDKRAVVRIKGKLFGTEPEGQLRDGGRTVFKGGDRASVSMDRADGRLSVTDSSTDHTQTWDPVDEVRKLIDEVIIESLIVGA